MAKCMVIKYDELVGYAQGLELQKKAFDFVHESEDIDGIILMLQHKKVFTTGRRGGSENIHISEEKLNELEIELFKSNRGGNVTFHGPGQLVVYPILKLSKFKKDIHWYVRNLEEVIIKTLETYNIKASRKEKYTGVWIENSKIAAIGVHVKKWITYHGFSFNIKVNKNYFKMINPCGITEYGIASLDDYVDAKYEEVVERIKEQFINIFNMELIESESNYI